MAKKRISDLPSKVPPSREDLVAIVDQQAAQPTTKKTTLGHILDLLNAITWGDRGAPGGVAALDSSGKIEPSQLPTILVGPTGPAGPAGASGITGATGLIGATGASGFRGATGVTGPTGPAGPTGAAGTVGATGLNGETGATGPRGITGATGAAGPTGVAGVIGVTGATGPQGGIGATGLTGETGATGFGETGATGLIGATGITGPTGLSGPTGASGSIGATGVMGPTGVAGATGPAGPVGPVGETGPIGAPGPSGAAGPPGATGVSGEPGATGIQGETGPTGVTGAAGPAGERGVTGATGVIGPIGATGLIGPQGETGPQGATGPIGFGVTGATGATGEQGATGAVGQPGAQGATGPVGATGLTGTTGEQGATGADGATGPVGEQGATGASGVQGDVGATGLTGATGTQGHTGATGVGEIGATGVTGPTGATGPVGAAGTPGAAGVTGASGATGVTGVTGPTGPQGVIGEMGATGVSGATGFTGATGPQGVAGTDGASATIVGTTFVWPPETPPNVGDIWLIGADSIVDLPLNTFAGDGLLWNGSEWLNIGQLRGPAGLQGVQGIQGLQGPSGPTGATGVGQTGATGFQGATGPTGPRGDIGISGLSGATGVPGATGVTGATGLRGPSGFDGAPGPSGIPGDLGATGATGATGFGETGATGIAGPTGATGLTGATGPAPAVTPHETDLDKIYVGGVLISAAQGATGVAGETGPTGVAGNIGQTGPQGETGATGATGPAPTVTPHETDPDKIYISGVPVVAVQGATGPAGVDGVTGATGPQGVPGINGLPGQPGATGPSGAAGTPGAAGATGATGPIGATGAGFVDGDTINGGTFATVLATTPPTTTIQFKRGTTENLAAVNPQLAVGEPCVEYNTGRFKIGDGVNNWNDLPYQAGKIIWQPAPAAFNSPGAAGDVAYNEQYLFVAVADNLWKRVAFENWTSIGITQQPTDQTAVDGIATFNVTAAASNGNPVTYQWEKQESNASTWTAVPGASSSALVLSELNAADNGDKYRVVVAAAGADAVTSTAATLSVVVPPLSIVQQPQDTTASSGDATFNVIAEVSDGSLITYQWEKSISSVDGTTWNTQLNRLPVGDGFNLNWRDIAYGNGLFVAVSPGRDINDANKIFATSSDGINWTARDVVFGGAWHVIGYGNGIFVAAAWNDFNRRVLVSTDGINWTVYSNKISASLNPTEIIYVTDQFFMFGALGGAFATSPDGINWTTQTATPLNALAFPQVVHGNNLFVAIGVAVGSSTYLVMTSSDAVTWVESALPVTLIYGRLTHGRGVFVIVGRDGANQSVILTSQDGVVWVTQQVPQNVSLFYDVYYAANIFIALAYDTTNNSMIMATSNSGTEWEFVSFNSSTAGGSSTRYTTYGNNTFVVLLSDVNAVLLNTVDTVFIDVADTNAATLNLTNLLNYDDGTQYRVTVAAENIDAVTSTAATLTVPAEVIITQQPQDMPTSSGSASFSVAATTNFGGTLRYQWEKQEADSETWAALTGETNTTLVLSNLSSPGDNGDKYRVVVSSAGTSTTSDAATLFITPTLTILQPPQNVLASGISAEFSVTVETNFDDAVTYQWERGQIVNFGTTWSLNALPATVRLNGITHGDGLFVAVGFSSTLGGIIATSVDGVTWSQPVAVSGVNNFSAVTYGNGTFVALGDSVSFFEPIAATSVDGVTWTVSNRPVPGFSIAYGNGTFVAIGGSYAQPSYCATSFDGVTWTQQTLPPAATLPEIPAYWTNVAYGNGTFVAVGQHSNVFATSPDGITWTQRTTQFPFSEWADIAYGNGTFVAVGAVAAISPDGVNWTAHELPAAMAGVTYGNGIFIAGSTSASNVFATSLDGINWTQHAGYFFTWHDLVYGNNTFVAVAAYNAYVAVSLPELQFSAIAGAVTSVLALTNLTVADTDTQYRVVVDALNIDPVTSTAATLTVSPASVITQQPQDVTAVDGAATFSVTAVTNFGGLLTYQWERQEVDGSAWVLLAGKTLPELALVDLRHSPDDGAKYRVVVSSEGTAAVVSDVATLTVPVPVISITQHPQDDAASAKMAQFSVTAAVTGGLPLSSLSFRWEKSENGSSFWVDLGSYIGANGTSNLSLIALNPENDNNDRYRAVVTAPDAALIRSLPATLTVLPYVITQQPQNVTAVDGTATFSVNIALNFDGTATYQWQKQAAGSSTWTTLTGQGTITSADFLYGSAELTLNNLTPSADNGDKYRVVIGGYFDEFLTSDAATLTVPTPVITLLQAPQSTVIPQDGTATFSVLAEVNGGVTLAYQWQKSESGSDSWANIAGANANTLSLTGLTLEDDAGDRYRVVLSAVDATSVTSSAGSLIGFPAITITQQPQDTTAVGGSAAFSVTAATNFGGTLVYLWEKQSPGSSQWQFLFDERTPELLLSGLTNSANDGTKYRVLVSADPASDVTSVEVTLTVPVPVISITQQPQDTTATITGEVTLNVAATVDTPISLTYQWQKSEDSLSWTDVSGATSATLTLTGLTPTDDSGDQYRVVISAAEALDAISNVATVTVPAAIIVTQQPENTTAVSGNATLSVAATTNFGATPAYQWQKQELSSSVWVELSGETAANLVLSGLVNSADNGDKYRVIIWVDGVASVVSDVAVLTVPLFVISITEQPQNVVVGSDRRARFNVIATVNGDVPLSYQWAKSENGFSPWVDLEFENSSELVLNDLTAENDDGDTYRVTITAPDAGVRVSSAATLFVPPQTWYQIGREIFGITANDNTGYSVSLSGDGQSLAVSSPGVSWTGFNQGLVRVYNLSAGDWVQRGDVIYGDGSARLGFSTAVNDTGTVVAMGGPFYTLSGATNRGVARVFEWSNNAWVQRGSGFAGASSGDQLGWSVSLSGDGNVIAIGAIGVDDASSNAGAVLVYEWTGAAWAKRGATITGTTSSGRGGWSVSLSSDGATLAVGEPQANSDAGVVAVYQWNGTAWTQVGDTIAGVAAGDWFGYAVSISDSGGVLAVGAPQSNSGAPQPGMAYVYVFVDGTWQRRGGVFVGDTGSDLGRTISLSGDGGRLVLRYITSSTASSVKAVSWNGTQWVQVGSDVAVAGTSVSVSAGGLDSVAVGDYLDDTANTDAGSASVYRLTSDVPPALPPVSSWSVATATSAGFLSVGSDAPIPRGVAVAPDGSKLFVVCDQNDAVFEYGMAIPWDVTTATLTQSFSIAPQATTLQDICFSDDGLSMYVLGSVPQGTSNTNNRVIQYSLSSAFDVSTAAFAEEFDVTAVGVVPTGISLGRNGTRLYTTGDYIANSTQKRVFAYTLSSPQNVASASILTTVRIDAQVGSAAGVQFKPDGSRMYVLDLGDREINEYYLRTPWDVSTAVFVRALSLINAHAGVDGFALAPDGYNFYLIDWSLDRVYRYSMT